MPGRIRVLYVDDEPGLLEVARIFLEQTAEFSVGISTSAQEALSNPSIRSYDAIVSDYQMPDMNGIEFLKVVRERFGNIPFILFTGKGREEVVIDAINNGADFYLQKGGDPRSQFAELEHKIRQAVAQKKGQDELKSAYEQIIASEEELRQQYEEIAVAQQKLLETQQQLTEIAGTIPGVMFQYYARPDGSWGFYYVSTRSQEVFGISHEADRFFDRFSAHADPRDRDAIMDSIKKAVSSASQWDIEGRFIKPSGETIWFQGLARPVKKGPELIYNGVLLDITGRKKAEEELRESERKLREAQEMAHLGFWSWDTKTGHVEWSDEVFRIFGIDPGEFVPQIDSILELSPWPDDHQRDKELIEKAIKSREPGMYEQRFLRPDKSTGYYYSTFQGRYDQSGNLTSIIGTVLDITGRKKAEEALLESEKRLRLFIQQAPAALAMFDTEMRYIAASRRWITDYHLGDEEIIGRSHYEIFPKIPEGLKAVHRWGLAGEVVSSDDDRFVREDGSVLWLAWEVRPWYTTGTVVGGIIIFSEDITKRKKAEAALRESEGKYRSLVEKANEAITIIQDLRMVYANPRMIDLVGIAAIDLLGMEFWETVWPEDREMLKTHYQQRCDGEDVPDNFDFRMIGPGGSPRWIYISIAMIQWHSRPATLNLMTDITERKLAEAALREASRKLGLLNSITRHDIVNQLTTLQGFTQIAVRKERDPVVAGYLAKIEASSSTIHRQIEFMKTYQELGVHTPGWFRLDELVAKAGRKEVMCSAACANAEIFADPMLEKVFFNLFENAMQHGGNVTEIRVGGEEVTGGLDIIVEDNGTGIQAGEKEKIFEKGFGKNTGLGLFLAKEILAITGITIRENGVPGKGARFEITVPKGKYRMIWK
ncbi:MAG: PAS domain S-box protein [Methanoregula sp.]|jgi:PAS domain S-box-containing protein|uniref:hybrid sensor histidine kinase/response regulator n=1 Tax=Methanoregula sp. TaxID=2052170 RepID=UPI0025EBB96E|nr:response regulator [Methanoregula sp.]MCK9631273.1 PAS domain S-box protein [Methanoregula sp.]